MGTSERDLLTQGCEGSPEPLVALRLLDELRASLTTANQQIEETEAYAKEGWDWLAEALDALGIENVFQIEEAKNHAEAKVEELTRERESSERHFTIALRAAQKAQDAAEAQRDTLREGVEKALAVPDNNRYGQASDPGSVLRETRDVLRSLLSTPPDKEGDELRLR